MKQITVIFILASILITAGCSTSTKLVGSWQNKELTNNHFEKIGVVAISPSESGRYLIERAVASDLKNKNINAMPTYEVFPFAGKMGGVMSKSENPEALKARIKSKVEEQKFDALMIISLLDKEKEQRYVQDYNSNYWMGGTGYYGTPMVVAGAATMPVAYGAYYNYYSYNLGVAYESGYYVEDVTYFLECNLYDVAKEELLWTARTKSTNIKSVEEEAQKFADMVVSDILAKKVIVP
jgi:hypothetical protein